jgi:hypothetical protein
MRRDIDKVLAEYQEIIKDKQYPFNFSELEAIYNRMGKDVGLGIAIALQYGYAIGYKHGKKFGK